MINAETFGRSFKCSLKVRNEDDECIGDSVKVKFKKRDSVKRGLNSFYTTSTAQKDSTVLYFRLFGGKIFTKFFTISLHSSVKTNFRLELFDVNPALELKYLATLILYGNEGIETTTKVSRREDVILLTVNDYICFSAQ